jgi:hypothetical protein
VRGGWILDATGLYEESVTMLAVAGWTQVVGIECCFDFSVDTDPEGYGDPVSRAISSERGRQGG